LELIIHHQPIDPSRPFMIHAWNGNLTWDVIGIPNGTMIDFRLPSVGDPRNVRFVFRWTNVETGEISWERDALTRLIRTSDFTEVWSFEDSARLLYSDPWPPGSTFVPNSKIKVHLLTERRFAGGRLYAWDPSGAASAIYVAESARQESVSDFEVTLTNSMTAGFNYKFVGIDERQHDLWEPDSSNRVWRPADGAEVWTVSGQVSVRKQPPVVALYPVEVLFPAGIGSPGSLNLIDPVEGSTDSYSPTISNFAADNRFKLATYPVEIYPDAAYAVQFNPGVESNNPYYRPFPSPHAPVQASRCVLGAQDWVKDFAINQVTLRAKSKPASSFIAGLTIQIGLDRAVQYDAVVAKAADGDYVATVPVINSLLHWIRLLPTSGPEPKPYDWIDARRFFVPDAASSTYYTEEEIYGISRLGAPSFAEPASRQDLMIAAFGEKIVRAGIFDARELPHGVTHLNDDVYFVVHAPHSASAQLVLVEESAAGPVRSLVDMNLTYDTLYWWCKVPATRAPTGARYRFLLNGDMEAIDPAAREVLDNGNFQSRFNADPADRMTSWGKIVKIADLYAEAHSQSWRTMGWESLILYEMHVQRFTNTNPNNLQAFELIAEHLKPNGYLQRLPVTALELLPIHEFQLTNSWGYNPAFFFAVEGSYGGPAGFAKFVRAAHASGKAVLLDVVYNHMNDSPLMRIAADVYSNGNAWGDRINSGHPMIREFLRQATVYVWRTFGLDGFRFDDTKTILGNVGGWDFMASIRNALRGAAGAEGQPWPFCVAENDDPVWNMTKPGWDVIDGEWHIDESFRVLDSSYDSWNSNDDHASALAEQLSIPQSWLMPYYDSVRFGESHDMVSGQDAARKRIAARPPFGLGYPLAKAVGALVILAKGVPMLFMGQESGETQYFSFDQNGLVVNPQAYDDSGASDRGRVLEWFRALLGLRKDPAKGLRGNDSPMAVRTGHRTIAFTCGFGGSLFVVVTFGTANQRQSTSWLGLPGGSAYNEIYNSSRPAFWTGGEGQCTNGGYAARINSGDVINLPYVGAIVLERCY
jgi:1,4-alpha-glucan branching enzyme